MASLGLAPGSSPGTETVALDSPTPTLLHRPQPRHSSLLLQQQPQAGTSWGTSNARASWAQALPGATPGPCLGVHWESPFLPPQGALPEAGSWWKEGGKERAGADGKRRKREILHSTCPGCSRTPGPPPGTSQVQGQTWASAHPVVDPFVQVDFFNLLIKVIGKATLKVADARGQEGEGRREGEVGTVSRWRLGHWMERGGSRHEEAPGRQCTKLLGGPPRSSCEGCGHPAHGQQKFNPVAWAQQWPRPRPRAPSGHARVWHGWPPTRASLLPSQWAPPATVRVQMG